MPLDFIKFAFSAGELSEDLHGRGDLEGFRFGYREGLNVLVDWRGGLRTRPGTILAEPVFEDVLNKGIRLSTFSFNTDPEDNYLLLWKHNRLFFLQEGRYLYTNVPKLRGNALLNGFVEGDIVLVHKRKDNDIGDYLFTGRVKDADEVYVPWKNSTRALNSNHMVVRAYSIITPYNAADLHDLKMDQFRDDVVITHRSYQPRVLRRTLLGDSPVFVLSNIDFLTPKQVQNKSSTARDRTDDFDSNTGGFQWTVAVVDDEGREFPLPYSDGDLVEDINIGTKILDLTWDAHADADRYKVYASVFKPDFDEALTPADPTINTTPNLPTIPPLSARVGTLFSFTFPIAVGGNEPIDYSLSPAVPGLTFVRNTRVFSGTPRSAAVHNLAYTATDADGESDTELVDFTVLAALAPEILPPNVPTNLRLVSKTTSSITLACDAPIGGGAPSMYRWRYSVNSNITESDPSVTSIGTTVTISGLQLGQQYWIVVRAENATGNSAFTLALVVTVGAGTPTRNTSKDITLPSGAVDAYSIGANADGTLLYVIYRTTTSAIGRVVYNTANRSVAQMPIYFSGSILSHSGYAQIGNTIWRLNRQPSPDKLEGMTSSFAEDNTKDITIAVGGNNYGLTTDGTTLWTCNRGLNKLIGFNGVSLSADTSKDIALGSGVWRGVVYGNGYIWAYNVRTRKLEARVEATKVRDSNKDYVFPQGVSIPGIAFANNTIWAASTSSNRILAIDV